MIELDMNTPSDHPVQASYDKGLLSFDALLSHSRAVRKSHRLKFLRTPEEPCAFLMFYNITEDMDKEQIEVWRLICNLKQKGHRHQGHYSSKPKYL